jgi:methyl coenzyme M reductase alpha subunit
MQPSSPRRAPRALRQSAYAAFAYAVLQMWFLPALIHRDADGWTWEPWTLLQVGLTLIVAVLIWRGSEVAAGIAAAYGVWRLGLAVLAVVSVLNGRAVLVENGPAWVLSQLVVLPFAIFWLRGGLAVVRERRARRSS